MHNHLNSHASFLHGTPFDSLNDEGAPSGCEPNASPPPKPSVPTDASNHNNDEVDLGIHMEKVLHDAWGACDAIHNESMRQTNNEDVD
jgi:hypothetical protein